MEISNNYIGEKIRYFRRERGLSSLQLAKVIGVSTQQLAKYETGVNRVAAVRLFDIAHALNEPIVNFYPERFNIGGNIEITPHQHMCTKIFKNLAKYSSIEQLKAIEILLIPANKRVSDYQIREIL